MYSPAFSLAEIERIGRGLADASLPRAEWTHAAHFAAALWLLHHHADGAAIMPGLIRRYNKVSGTANTDTTGYHETITQASLRAARFYLDSHDEPLDQVLARLLASPLGRQDWLFAYWSRDRLFSVQARKAWVKPDIQPLPY